MYEQEKKLNEIRISYENRLKVEYESIKKEKEEQENRISEANQKIEETSKKLSDIENDNKTNKFFNDLTILFEMMKKQTSILLVSLFIVMVALMIDLIPILTKLQVSRGVYAKMISDEEEIKKSISELNKKEIITELERKNLEIEKLKLIIAKEKGEIKETEIVEVLRLKELEAKANKILAHELKEEETIQEIENISKIDEANKTNVNDKSIKKEKKKINSISHEFINQIKSTRNKDEDEIMEDIKKEL